MLKIHNSLSGKKERFVPLEAGKVRMYVCGITVYDYLHLGHARMLIVFDMITRWLRASGYQLTYARNITDVDDKIIARANENGEDIDALTARFIDAMNEDCAALDVLTPTYEPRATETMAAIIAMIEELEANGYAYRGDNGDVYYAVAKFDGYGTLSGKIPAAIWLKPALIISPLIGSSANSIFAHATACEGRCRLSRTRSMKSCS